MQLTSIVTALTFAATTLALPSWGPWAPWGGNPGACLDQAGVDKLVEGYTYLLEHPGGPDFNSTAMAILSTDFMVYSDSINTLSQRPLGPPAYPSLEVYILTQFVTPPLPVVTTIEVFNTCDKIAWRWNATGEGSNMYRINGIITMDVNPATTQIDTLYSEFNTAAFEADLGYPECKQA